MPCNSKSFEASCRELTEATLWLARDFLVAVVFSYSLTTVFDYLTEEGAVTFEMREVLPYSFPTLLRLC